ncbi:MAG: hypothetical protein AAGG38_14385 [Planctomycetota bacterium]
MAVRLARGGMLVLVLVAGCGRPFFSGGLDLQLTSRDRADGPALELGGSFTRAVYRVEDKNTVTVVLVQGRAEDPQRIATMRMFWRPVAGRTPIDRTATNALVRYYEFRDSPEERDTLGLYAGGGFMRLDSDPNLNRVTGTLWDADLRLTDRSEAFVDRLGRAVLAGRFTAGRDDAGVTELLHRLNQQVEERLGYPRLVRAVRRGGSEG